MDNRKRFSIQAVAALLQNANFKGFFSGKIYSGPLKQICVPGLNCYSCPGALGACPLGSLQNSLSALKFRFPYYVVGMLLFFGAFLGRAVCGFLCPFGWIQELIHRIPFFKRNRFRADRPLRNIKYIILALLVIILPLTVKLTPLFCKYLCPAGTSAGILLAVNNTLVSSRLGFLFTWKAVILGIILVASLIIWRPFCKDLCPLGARYGLFNRFSLIRMHIDPERCISCGSCSAACRMNIDPVREINHAECIRCGDCVRACPCSALNLGMRQKRTQTEISPDHAPFDAR